MFALNRDRPWFSIFFVSPHPNLETILASVCCNVFLAAFNKIWWEAQRNSGIPFSILGKTNWFLHLHNLDVIQIFGDASHHFAVWIDFAFFNNPWFSSGYYTLRKPSWHGPLLENKTSGDKWARGCVVTSNDIARDDMRRVGVWIAKEKGQCNDRPRIAGKGNWDNILGNETGAHTRREMTERKISWPLGYWQLACKAQNLILK